MTTFVCLAQILLKYCQKGIDKHILIIETNSQDFKTKDKSERKRKLTLLPIDQWHVKSRKMIFDTPVLKVRGFIYLCALA